MGGEKPEEEILSLYDVKPVEQPEVKVEEVVEEKIPEPVVSEVVTEQPVVNNSSDNGKLVLIILSIVGGCVLLFFILYLFVFKSGNKAFEGEWTCDGGVTLNFDGSTMKYVEGSSDIEAKYTIIDKEEEGIYDKYTINVEATKRIIDGQEYTDPYSTQFQLMLEKGNKDKLGMMNTISYSMYSCTRK